MKHKFVLLRQAERYYEKSEEKDRVQVRERLVILEDEAYSGKRLHGDLKEFQRGKRAYMWLPQD